MVAGAVLGRVLSGRAEDRYRKYYARKSVHYVVAVITVVGLGILWRPFAGQLGLVLGLVAAGLMIGIQDLIGSLAGWFNIQSGSIFRVGDRVEIGGVRGDVIDITPLRTKLMEIGSSVDDDAWVRGRQYTERIVAVSNKATFSDPVVNYSASFEFIWEEVMIHRYPVARTEVEPRVFVNATDNYLEISARFVVPVRRSRWVRDELTRRILDRFAEVGIPIASATQNITIRADTIPGTDVAWSPSATPDH